MHDVVAKSTLIFKVLVFDLETDREIRNHTIKLTDVRKQWLINLFVWAACNGKSVEIVSLNDDRKYNNR